MSTDGGLARGSSSTPPARAPLAIYWGAACGGCEIAVLDTEGALLDLDRGFELVFCPCFVDAKRADVEALPDGAIFATLFDGALRTTHDLAMARLLRRKSRHLVAFGSCAVDGCTPGLANLAERDELLRRVYVDAPTAEPGALPPGAGAAPPGAPDDLPALLPRVAPLAGAVAVDYLVPGCPPEPRTVRAALAALAAGWVDPAALPPRGGVIGGGRTTVCDECARPRDDAPIARLRRTFEVAPARDVCLLREGLVCMGPATRDGCGAPCPAADAPCVGCYGAPEGVHDQGARMATLIGSVLDVGPLRGVAEGGPLEDAIDARLDAVPDWVGTLYKHGLAASLLGRVRHDRGTGGRR